MKNLFTTLILLLLTFPSFSQGLSFDIFGTLTNPYADPYLIVTLDSLEEAKTINDLSRGYRSSWVERFNAVEVSSSCTDGSKKAISTSDSLTPEQLAIFRMAETGCKVDVDIDYIPANNLKDNPPRKMNYSFKMIPIFEAKFSSGYQGLRTYLQEKVIDKIEKTRFEQIKLATVKFNISEEGKVTDAHISETSKDEQIDTLMLEAICALPNWSPAKNAEGQNITQEFEFSLGTSLIYGCYKVR